MLIVIDLQYADVLLNSLLSLLLARCLSRYATANSSTCAALLQSNAAVASSISAGVLLVATNRSCLEYLRQRGLQSLTMLLSDFPSPPAGLSSDASAASSVQPVSSVFIYRWWLLWCVLSLGIDVLHSDADVVYVRDPSPYFRQRERLHGLTVDIHSGSGVYPASAFERLGFTLQGGFIRLRSSGRTLRFVQQAVQAGFLSASKDDQVAANAVLIRWLDEAVEAAAVDSGDKGSSPASPSSSAFRLPCVASSPSGRCFNLHIPSVLTVHVVDSHLFLTGGVQRYGDCKQAPPHRRPEAIVVHPTAVDKQRAAKTAWLRAEHYWLLRTADAPHAPDDGALGCAASYVDKGSVGSSSRSAAHCLMQMANLSVALPIGLFS